MAHVFLFWRLPAEGFSALEQTLVYGAFLGVDLT
jgi:hypothetical protein